MSGQVKERIEMVAEGRAEKDTRPLLLFPEVGLTAKIASFTNRDEDVTAFEPQVLVCSALH